MTTTTEHPVPAPLNPPTARTALTPAAPVHAVHGIELRAVDKTYKTPSGPVRAVNSIDLVVDAGETVALLGPNGAGKSTTIDLLLGLQRPDSGTVSVFGSPPSNAIADGRIGAMLQIGAMLRELTVRELVTMMSALHPRPLPVDETLELAQLREIEHRRTEKLSGGQTQRVRFAIALAGDPDLLVLDEPTVGLDVETRQAFWTTVRNTAAQGKTILFATHYLDEADRYADRAVLMAQGRVVADGPTTEIKARVGTRTIQATLPDVPAERLETLAGVTAAERHGEAIAITSADSDATIRVLLDRYPQIRDIEIRSAGLEQAFLQLTGEEAIAA
jgi:ABC-2 type transport system ATP-binding protein